MCTGLVMKLDYHEDNGTAPRGKLGVESRESLRCSARHGRDGAAGWPTELGIQAPHDRNDPFAGAEMPKKELSAGSFGKGQKPTGVDTP